MRRSGSGAGSPVRVVVGGRGRPPEAAARRAGLEVVERLLTITIDAANKTALGAVK
jgi:hypothetical protein